MSYTLRSIVALALVAATSAPAVRADDRDLLRTSGAEPYVMILFDVSGSMNWTTQCTAAQLAAGTCNYLCPNIDCTPRAMGDDPASKMRQAKEAIHQVLNEVENVHFGFATYNQNNVRATYKHWLYQARSNGPALAGSAFWPRQGAIETFGYDFGCDSGNNDFEIPCYITDVADLDDAWEVERALRAPKLGDSGNDTDYIYVRSGGTRYRIRYQRNAGNLGDAYIDVRYLAERCLNSDCSSRSALPQVTVRLDRVTDFFHWESNSSGGRSAGRSFFPNEQDTAADGTCNGWDPNTDTSSDDYGGENIRQTTTSTDPRGNRFYVGDVIPMDWNTDNRALIQSRLAPNGVDFTQASYFQDHPSGGILQLRDDNEKPLLAQGSTPLGASMDDFHDWYHGTSSTPGWADIAALQDPNWVCRAKYLIVVTDGDETCNGSPASVAGTLNQAGNDRVRTYVVGFGLQSSSSLAAIANAGGTGVTDGGPGPIFPQNKQELIDALTNIFGEIGEETRSFASATVPSVQADISDRVYVSRFLPFDNESYWSGHIDAFIKPIPYGTSGPDTTVACTASRESACFLWDAGAQLLAQDGLGLTEDQRRVFYVRDLPTAAIPATKRVLAPPAGDPGACPGYPPTGCSEWWDLFYGLGLDPATAPATLASNTTAIIDTALGVKSGSYEVTLPNGTTTTVTEESKLGDLFHSDPLYVERPLDFELLAIDPYSTGGACAVNPGSYPCFAQQHKNRRKLLFVGANDGMLHAFDVGRYEGTVDNGAFNTGTGKEVFAIMPRAALPIVRDQARGDEQIYSMDGAPRSGDVYIDPVHNGTPNPNDREWRTILVAGMREGGNKFPSQEWVARFEHQPNNRVRNAYVAIDVTQPDTYDSDGLPTDGVVPSCLRLDSTIPSGCGSLPYPSVMWEYSDIHPTTRVSMDEDLNGQPDLGDTWSRPILGRVATDRGLKEVAIFGGGMDTPFRNGTIGNWIYMVDVETGRTMYKRRVVGAVAGEVSAQDRDNNTVLDYLYFGTSSGLMYKVDLTEPGVFAEVLARDLNGTILRQPRVTNNAWEPFPIFQTGPAAAPGPIFYGPTIFYVAKRAQFALAFGTGDRENLWSEVYGAGRFYVLRDTGFTRAQYLAGDLPKTEADYTAIDPDGGTQVGSLIEAVPDPSTLLPGWYFTLDDDERVITRATGLVGFLSFTAFSPRVEFLDVDEDAVCARTGNSRIFAVQLANGNPPVPGHAGAGADRYREVTDFATSPTLEQVQTKNRPTDEEEPIPFDDLQLAIIESAKGMFPEGTRFGNYYYQIAQRTSRNERIPEIPIPIGIIINNWKEF